MMTIADEGGKVRNFFQVLDQSLTLWGHSTLSSYHKYESKIPSTLTSETLKY